MKRFLILILTLCLCFPTVASAGSLFPSLATPEPAAAGDIAPSYGAMANVDPDDVQPYAEGGQVVTYEHVDEQSYEEFGDYLLKLGFEAVDQNVEGQTVEMMLSNGKFNIGVAYYGDEQRLLMIYEEGVDYMKRDYFPGYTRVKKGETFTINSGEITITDVVIDGSLQCCSRHLFNSWGENPHQDIQMLSSYVLFSYKNTTTSDVRFYSTNSQFFLNDPRFGSQNALGNISIVYISDGGSSYTYNMELYGTMSNEHLLYGTDVGTLDDDSARFRMSPLNTYSLGAAFTLPEGVKEATDGILAVTINDEYVIILRENGKKVGDW